MCRLDRIRFLDVNSKKKMKSECRRSQANKMKSIRYIWSFMPFRSNARINPNNLGLKSHISMLMSTLNFSFVYVFIIYFWSWERKKRILICEWHATRAFYRIFRYISLYFAEFVNKQFTIVQMEQHMKRVKFSHWIRRNFRIIFLR